MRQPSRAQPFVPSGFTLLQLVIVIAIVGLLGAIAVTAAWREVGRTRDAKRVHALREVQEALELYWIDNRVYPSTSGNWRKSCISSTNYDLNYIPGLAPKYMAELPKDPLPCTHDGYYYKSNGTDYKFQSHNESSTQKPSKLLLTFLDPAWDFGPNLCIIDGDTNYPWATEHFAVYTLGYACQQ